MTCTRHAVAAGLVASALLAPLAGCGLNQPPPVRQETANSSLEPGQGQIVQDEVHNAQDAAFATDMITHHRQTLAVAALAQGRSQNAKMRDLAQRMESERTPEVREMSRWLTEWKVAVPTGSTSPAGHAIPGMISTTNLAKLTAANGEVFDRLFLTLMVDHLRGGLLVARDQIRTGADERARGLADDIAVTCESEIAQLQALRS